MLLRVEKGERGEREKREEGGDKDRIQGWKFLSRCRPPPSSLFPLCSLRPSWINFSSPSYLSPLSLSDPLCASFPLFFLPLSLPRSTKTSRGRGERMYGLGFWGLQGRAITPAGNCGGREEETEREKKKGGRAQRSGGGEGDGPGGRTKINNYKLAWRFEAKHYSNLVQF